MDGKPEIAMSLLEEWKKRGPIIMGLGFMVHLAIGGGTVVAMALWRAQLMSDHQNYVLPEWTCPYKTLLEMSASSDKWKQGVCHHIVALPFTLKSIIRQKKNYGNSNISPCNKYNLQKNPLKETKLRQDILTLLLFSSFNTSQNIIFQKSSFQNTRHIIT